MRGHWGEGIEPREKRGGGNQEISHLLPLLSLLISLEIRFSFSFGNHAFLSYHSREKMRGGGGLLVLNPSCTPPSPTHLPHFPPLSSWSFDVKSLFSEPYICFPARGKKDGGGGSGTRYWGEICFVTTPSFSFPFSQSPLSPTLKKMKKTRMEEGEPTLFLGRVSFAV